MADKVKLVYPAMMALMMSFLMSGVITAINLGIGADFATRWMSAWATVFPVALVAVYFTSPLAHRATRAVVVRIWGREALAER